MIRAAALTAGLVLLASGCGGGGTAPSAAGVAPANVRAFVALPIAPLDAPTRRALALTPDGLRLQAIADRAAWARAVHRRVEVAQLADGRLVAFARLKETKGLDAAGLAHARIRGWTAFAPTKDAVEAARAKRHLDDTRWYTAAAKAAGTSGTTFVAPGWLALAAEGGEVRRSAPGRGTDTPTPEVPKDTIAATGAQDGAALLRSPFATGVERVLGLPLGRLAPLAPAGAVLYVRPGAPIPAVTLLAQDGSLTAARRVVRALAPVAPPAVSERVNGLLIEHVSLGATDLFYGRSGRTLVFSDDTTLSLGGKSVVPASTSDWLYVDAPKARAALEMLATLHAGSAPASMQRTLHGLDSVVEYTTHEHGVATTTVVIR